ncbi:2Fe-2S iron-sulfur cluster-binding protein [Myxococcota bacterium]
MTKDTVKLNVFRFNPIEDNKPRYQEYGVERSEKMSVLSAIQYIYENLDGSLSMNCYYCYRKLCGLCVLRINGKNRLSCGTLVEGGMIIGPARGYRLSKDLAVDFSRKVR